MSAIFISSVQSQGKALSQRSSRNLHKEIISTLLLSKYCQIPATHASVYTKECSQHFCHTDLTSCSVFSVFQGTVWEGNSTAAGFPWNVQSSVKSWAAAISITLAAVLLSAAEVILVVGVGVSGGTGITAHGALPLALQDTGLKSSRTMKMLGLWNRITWLPHAF